MKYAFGVLRMHVGNGLDRSEPMGVQHDNGTVKTVPYKAYRDRLVKF